MKIVIIQGAFLPVPPLMGGAVEKRWFLLGQEFVKRGHEVVHISRRHPSLSDQEVIDGVSHIRVSGYNAPKSGIILKGMDLIYSLRASRKLPDADILVTNTFWAPILIKNKRKGLQVVDVARMPKGQMKLYRQAACLRANSSPVGKAILADDYQAKGRTATIPNPLPFIPDRDVKWRRKQNTLLYVGRVHPEKGIELLLESFSRLPADLREEWKLRLVGPTDVRYGGGGGIGPKP